MKITLIIVSMLTLVGSCAHKSHREKVKDIKDAIIFQDKEAMLKYAQHIDTTDLKAHLSELSSDAYQGRKTGEIGFDKAAKYVANYYDSQYIASPLDSSNYFQNIPKSALTKDLKASKNVVAFIEGSTQPDEILVISSHLDHLGMSGDTIYNGADDNGSGTSALLEIAQAFNNAKKDGFAPKRSILFLHFTGEEQGLFGSKFYSEHPIFPLKNTVANLNIDMIGRVDNTHKNTPNYLYIIGADRLSTELHYISEKANDKFSNLILDYKFNAESDINQYYYRSDHYNFAKHNIPVIFYFNGGHEDYHKSSDTAEKINYPLLKKRSDLIFYTAWHLANSHKRIVADKI